jgi:uncharacterized membrane protein
VKRGNLANADNKVGKPKNKLRTTVAGWILETIGLLGIILTVTYVLLNYCDLPDTIPIHYNLTGQPDGFGRKSILFVLPSITMVIYLILTIGLRFPHLFNYPFEITGENAERQYKNITVMVRILKALIAVIFLYLTYATIQNGLGEINGLGPWFMPVALCALLGTVGFFLYRGSGLC